MNKFTYLIYDAYDAFWNYDAFGVCFSGDFSC